MAINRCCGPNFSQKFKSLCPLWNTILAGFWINVLHLNLYRPLTSTIWVSTEPFCFLSVTTQISIPQCHHYPNIDVIHPLKHMLDLLDVVIEAEVILYTYWPMCNNSVRFKDDLGHIFSWQRGKRKTSRGCFSQKISWEPRSYSRTRCLSLDVETQTLGLGLWFKIIIFNDYVKVVGPSETPDTTLKLPRAQ